MQELLDAISKDFTPSRGEIIWTIVLAAGFVFLLFIFNRIFSWRERRKTKDYFRGRFNRAVRELDLTINELDLVNDLAVFLKEPEKKYVLLQNANTFDLCLNHLQKQTPSQKTLKWADALRQKCKYSERETFPDVKTTKDIGLGTALRISMESGKRITAIVEDKDKESLKLKILDDPEQLFRKGGEVRLYYNDPKGFYSFTSTVTEREEEFAELKHVPVADRKIRSANNLNLKVMIKGQKRNTTAVASTILSINGRDAMVTNPDNLRIKDDDLFIYFKQGKNNWSRTAAEVIAVNKVKETMKIRLSHLRDDVLKQIDLDTVKK